MPVTVEQVPKWFASRGIGHAVAGPWASGYGWMACGMVTNVRVEDLTDATPKRICRACRRALKTLSLSPPAAAAG